MARRAGATRRNILLDAGSLAAQLAVGAPLLETSSTEQANKLKFVVCGGHPGDPEYGCGGMVARLTKRGHDVRLLYLNDGGWPPTSSSTRIAEARKACEILGCQPIYAGQANGHAIVDSEHYDQYRAILEKEKPDAVLTQWPIDNHRDHRACSTLTYDAWRQLKRSFALYYYEVSNGEDTLQFSPTIYFDITEQEPVKRAACYAHASQTPDRYYALQDAVARFRGLESRYSRAEAFILQAQSPSDVLKIVLASA